MILSLNWWICSATKFHTCPPRKARRASSSQVYFSPSPILTWGSRLSPGVVDPKKALQVDSIILPGTLKAVRPTTVAALYDLVESVKGQRFNFMLAECQAHYQSLNEKGGSVLALKTQRYEEMDSLVLEIGWAWETHSGKKRTKDGSEHGNIVDDSAAFRSMLSVVCVCFD